MAFVLGVCGEVAMDADGIRRWVCGLSQSFGTARPRIWYGEDGVFAHVQSFATPEDHLENQPLSFANGQRVLVFEGRLDNRDELMPQLELSSHVVPDSVVVAAALERWGDQVCNHLAGDFALACWDRVQRRLLLACDPVGGRTLYYYIGERHIVFSTMANAVHESLGRSCRLDLDALSIVLLNRRPSCGRSFFQGIRQLLPGNILFWSEQTSKIQTYWQPDWHHSLHLANDQEYVEAARHLLDKVMSSNMRSSGLIACHLSGGLDSGAVTATAAKLTSIGRLAAITTVPGCDIGAIPCSPRYFYDESGHAEAVARLHPVIDHYKCAAEKDKISEDYYNHLFWSLGGPMRLGTNISWYGAQCNLQVNLAAKVVLSGQSGNGTLSFDGGRHLADLAESRNPVALIKEVYGMARQGGAHGAILRGGARYLTRKTTQLLGIKEGGSTPRILDHPIHPQFLSRLDLEQLLRHDRRVPGLSRDLDWQRWVLHNCSMTKTHTWGIYAHQPYQFRDPLGDVRLVEFCISLPRNQYLRHGVNRFLARRVLADRLPDMVINEKRGGFQNPEWFFRMSGQRDFLIDTIAKFQQSALLRELLDLPRMERLVTNWPASVTDADYIALNHVLYRGIHVGQFVLWFENGGKPPEPLPPFPVINK